jgi:hypothetical protein
MAKTYVTFGQDHRHVIAGEVFDKDCVAVLVHPDDVNGHGRDLAFDLFGPKFCFEYDEYEFLHNVSMDYFPRGLINVQHSQGE